jgi:hypothetical protein
MLLQLHNRRHVPHVFAALMAQQLLLLLSPVV